MTKTHETWILVADDDRAHRDMLRANLEHAGYSVMEVTNGSEAVKCVKTQHPDLVLTDMRMPEMDGLTAVREIRKIDERVPILIMTAYGTIENAVQTVKAGAYDYILKPLDMSVLLNTIKTGLEKRSEPETQSKLASDDYIAESPAMKDIFALAEKVARSEASVLLTGESGTGKDVLANFIQQKSARSGKPFVKVETDEDVKELFYCSLVVNNHDLDDWLVFRLGVISGEVNSLKQIIRKMGGSNDGRSSLDA